MSKIDKISARGGGRFRLLFAHGFSLEFDPMSAVYLPIEDRIGDGFLADQVVPFTDRDLGCDQGRTAAMAVFDDFQQVQSVLMVQWPEAKVVQDQQVGAFEPSQELVVGAGGPGRLQLLKKFAGGD